MSLLCEVTHIFSLIFLFLSLTLNQQIGNKDSV